ncbi:MAG: HAD-IIA family hydrolase [Actinomycetota bacterium]|nr:HAD-IIA family hydrolase [Actinomycetota bacterium]
MSNGWVIDLDGVVWLLDDPIPGSVEAINALLDAGVAVTFATNNSSLTQEEYRAKLSKFSIRAQETTVITSSMAAASLLDDGSSVFVVGASGIYPSLEERGIEAKDSSEVDAVVVGWDREITYSKIARAAKAIHNGAKFIATNLDPTYPTPQGLLPGAGSIVAAIATAGLKKPIVAGKPGQAMADLLVQVVGKPRYMVGDRIDTDGAFAQNIGCDFAMVLSGVSKVEDIDEIVPSVVAADLSELVRSEIGSL